MPMWGNTDVAGNSALFAAAQVKLAPNTANRTALYQNTTANSWFGSGEIIGQYGVSADEARAVRAAHGKRAPGPGWVLRTTDSGGRAGRVRNELLVAMHGGPAEGGGGEDVAFPDFTIVYTAQPSSTSANSSANEIAKFSANAHNVPAGGSLTYQWQKWGGAAFANVANAGAYSNVTTKELSVKSNTAANGETYRVGAYQSGAVTAFSSNATLTITT